MLEKLSWKQLIAEFALISIPALLLGILCGHLVWCWLTATLCLLLWHFYNLMRLSQWLWVDKSMTPPPGSGSWAPVMYGLHLHQRRNKKRRKELGGLIKRFRSGAESLPDAVVLTTDEGDIFWCNQLAQRLLHLRWPADAGQNIQNLLRYPEFHRFIQEHDFTQALNLQLNNGRHLEFRVMPYSAGQRLIVARDVTKIHRLENLRRRFFADVNHELRTPLTVLQGYLEIMAEGALPEAQREKALDAMREQTQRMDTLVKQLLTLSRIEAKPEQGEHIEVDICTLLGQIKREAHALGPSHEVSIDAAPNLQVVGSESLLYSIIANLILNAIGHTPEGTRVTVSWRKTPQGGSFCVSDNGPGIPAEHIPRLTERFYRVDAARGRCKGGSGLGLAIVKHALEQYGSTLIIESAPGQGARFSFVLPDVCLVTHDAVSSLEVDAN